MTQGNDGVEPTWLRFVSTGDGDVVAVDTTGRYGEADEVSVVSSCDVFEFDGSMTVRITSYVIELSSEAL